MRFRCFLITPSLSAISSKLEEAISSIDPEMRKTESPSPDSTLIITTAQEIVSYAHLSKAFVISDSFVLNLYAAHSSDFPLTTSSRHRTSNCLEGSSISFSHIEKSELKILCLKVQLMGGSISTDLTQSTSILVANEPLSHRYIEAIKIVIPIVNSQWINDSFDSQSKLPILPYSVPCFYHLRFTSSDLPSDIQKHLKQCICENGGMWTSNLEEGTNLIVASSLTDTEKVNLALVNSIPIVSPDWIKKCASFPSSPKNECLNSFQFCASRGIFQGMSFSLNHDLANIKALTELIEGNSGTIDGRQSILVVPHNYSEDKGENVTPKWIWDSVNAKTLIDRTKSVLFSPFKFTVPMQGFSGKAFSLVSMSPSVRAEIAYAIRALGGTVVHREWQSSAFWIMETSDHQIAERAEKFNIKCVTPLFVLDSIKNGVMADASKYEVIGSKKRLEIILKSIKEAKKSKERIKDTINHINLNDFSQNTPTQVVDSLVGLDQTMQAANMDEIRGDPLIEYLAS